MRPDKIHNHQLGPGWKIGNVEVYRSGWVLVCSKYGQIIFAFHPLLVLP